MDSVCDFYYIVWIVEVRFDDNDCFWCKSIVVIIVFWCLDDKKIIILGSDDIVL